jgi:HD-like signal output (HDOD) protein
MTISRSSLSDIVKRLHALPSLPEVVMQITRATADPMVNSRQIYNLVVKDAAISAKCCAWSTAFFTVCPSRCVISSKP